MSARRCRPQLESLEARQLLAVNVLTYHYDNARTGWDPHETQLTPANVNARSFGRLFTLHVDGKVDAQPLYMANVHIAGHGVHNVVFVATENDSVYAFDADRFGAPLWHVRLLGPGEVPSDNRGCEQITPEIGVTSTPVIDARTGTMYVVAMSKSGSTYFQRIYALSVSSGADVVAPVVVQASVPGSGPNSQAGQVTFNPAAYAERTSLLLLNGVIYTMWTSHCDEENYNGWVIGYSAGSLQQTSILNLTPNGTAGSFWNSGAGAAADAAGNIFQLEANGTFDTTLLANGFPAHADFGNSFLKLSTSGGLQVADYFAPHNVVAENAGDRDFGSGGVIVLPNLVGGGQVRQLAVGAGKDGNIYLVDRNDLGKFHASGDHIYQELQGALPGGEFGTAAYFDGAIYYGSVGQPLKQFVFRNAHLAAAPAAQSATAFGYPGTTPSVSSNGAAHGIVWAAQNGSVATLHAYDAHNLGHELYNSNQAGSRDHFGTGDKFITPMIANGKVYVGTTNGVGVFGLLAGPRA